jgi:hypothetical protein
MSLSASAPHTIEDRGPTAVAVYWTQVGVATVIVAARFYTRKRMRMTGVDDWLMLVTLVSSLSMLWQKLAHTSGIRSYLESSRRL